MIALNQSILSGFQEYAVSAVLCFGVRSLPIDI